MQASEDPYRPVFSAEDLDRLDTVYWIYDIDRKRVAWANAAAIRLWDADSLEELRARDLSADMSRTVEQRLQQYREDFERYDSVFREAWTFYPKGRPRKLRMTYRGRRMPDGRMAMLCEGTEEIASTPEAMRSAEAVLHTSVAISLFSPDGAALYSNPAARACYGGRVRTLAARFACADDARRIGDAVREDGMFEGAVAVTTLAGERWHQIRAYACRDAVTGDRAILFSETDVTEAHLARVALTASRNEALEASRLKTEFVANMSHEIRTPLNGVLGLAQLMRNTDLSEEQAELLAMIESSGAALLGIIEDILDISKIEAGQLRLDSESYSPRALASEAVDTVFFAAAQKEIAIRRIIDPDAPDLVLGDAKRVRQVLINLLGNAIKFSHDADIHLRVEACGPGVMKYSVTDRGVGIAPDQQEAVFERFRQADGSLTRNHGGAGLGLAICRTLVEMMGGEIGVVSAPGEGSTFWFTIASPLAPAPAAPAADAEPVAGDGPRAALPLLIAEDNATNQFIISRALNRRGYRTDAVTNGAEALEKLRAGAYGLVVMDIQMPVMSGSTAIERIRSGAVPDPDIPIIALTANATPEAMAETLRAGASAYLTKPVDLEALFDRIETLMRRSIRPAAVGGA